MYFVSRHDMNSIGHDVKNLLQFFYFILITIAVLFLLGELCAKIWSTGWGKWFLSAYGGGIIFLFLFLWHDLRKQDRQS
jgi:hypothetical protein